MSDEDTVLAEVRQLEMLDLEGLRAAWRARYGAPPKLRSVDLLRRMLAWRIQAIALGGLDAQTGLRLRRGGAGLAAAGSRPSVGATVTREYRGRRHEVQVVQGGFVYDGVTYASLSKVAHAITGTRWNGPLFFGLRKAAA